MRRPGVGERDREILALAVPALGALIAEPLFLLADSAIVGHLGTLPLAGLGVAGTALTTLVSVFVFLAYATTAAVARRIGAGDLPSALRQGVDGLWLAGGLGVVVTAFGVGLAPQVVRWLGAGDPVAPYAETYLRIAMLGAPAMLLVLAATGVLRGLQDTRTPLLVAATGAAVNVGLNVALVYGVGLGIAGSALGTTLTQWGMAAVYLAIVVRGARGHGVGLRPDAGGVRASARAGVPLLVRTLTLRAAIVLTTYVAARLGAVPLAAHQVAFTLWGLLALALDAVAIAGQAIVGRYLGADDAVGARAATSRMVAWGIGSGAALGLLTWVARPVLVPLFTPDPDVQAQLAAALVVVALLQPLSGLVFVLDGVLIGAGDGRYLAAAGVLTLVAFVPLALLVLDAEAGSGTGLVPLWWAFGGFMLARAVTLVARSAGSAWLVTGAVRAR